MKKKYQLNAEDKARLQKFLQNLEQEKSLFIGYPCSELYDYSELNSLFRYSLNNIGDPYKPSNYHLNSHTFEQQVLDYFTELMHADKKSVWGYVTNGGTEGNLYGLYLARESHPDGIVYYSQDSHYSVDKTLRLLNMKSVLVKSLNNGEIDYQDLTQQISKRLQYSVIIFANIGTTIKGAIDNLDTIHSLLNKLQIKRYYIHADEAFFGMILPFLKNPPAFGFDAGVDSLSISGHKMIGSPMPCGVVLSKKTYIDAVAKSVEYIGTVDDTISGSRNGITPMLLWYAISTHSQADFSQLVAYCFDLADYAIDALNKLNLGAWRNPDSFIVVFDYCAPAVLSKWQIATYNNLAHIIPMPHVKKSQIEQFIAELKIAIKAK